MLVLLILSALQTTGQKITGQLSGSDAVSVIVELDWTESVDNPDDK